MLSSVYIFSRGGNVIVSKHCRDVPSASLPAMIFSRIKSDFDEHCFEMEDKTIVWSTDSQQTIYYVGVACEEVQPLFVASFFRRLDHNLRVSLTSSREIKLPGRDETPFSDTLLRQKRSVVVQILEEVLDGGFVTNMEANCIAAMIPQIRAGNSTGLSVGQSDLVRAIKSTATDDLLPEEATTALPWRRPGVVHSTNGIYFDVIEAVNATFTPQGTPALLSVQGRIRASCLISGTPDVEVRVNDPQLLADATVHPCVRYRRLERRGVLSFIPPDGEFDLVTYSCNHVTASVAVPIKVKPVYQISPAGIGSFQVELSVLGSVEVHDVVCDVVMPHGIVCRNIKQTHGSSKCFHYYDADASLLKISVGHSIAPAERTQLTRTSFDDPGVPENPEKAFKPGDRIIITCAVSDKNYSAAASTDARAAPCPFRPTVSLSYSFSGQSASGLRVKGVDIKLDNDGKADKPPFKGLKTTTVSNDVVFLC